MQAAYKSLSLSHTHTHHEQNALGLVPVHAAPVHAKRARVLPRDHALPAVRQLAVEQCDLRALGELDRLARVPRDGRLGGDMNGVSTFHRDGLTGQISMNKYGGNIVRK